MADKKNQNNEFNGNNENNVSQKSNEFLKKLGIGVAAGVVAGSIVAGTMYGIMKQDDNSNVESDDSSTVTEGNFTSYVSDLYSVDSSGEDSNESNTTSDVTSEETSSEVSDETSVVVDENYFKNYWNLVTNSTIKDHVRDRGLQIKGIDESLISTQLTNLKNLLEKESSDTGYYISNGKGFEIAQNTNFGFTNDIIIKNSYVMYLFKEMERGNIDIENDTIMVKAVDISDFRYEKTLEEGVNYSILNIVEQMYFGDEYTKMTAYNMLTRNYGFDGYNSMMQDLGINNMNLTEDKKSMIISNDKIALVLQEMDAYMNYEESNTYGQYSQQYSNLYGNLTNSMLNDSIIDEKYDTTINNKACWGFDNENNIGVSGCININGENYYLVIGKRGDDKNYMENILEELYEIAEVESNISQPNSSMGD